MWDVPPLRAAPGTDLASFFPGAETALELAACASGVGDAALFRALAPLSLLPASFRVVVFGGSYPKGCDCDSPLFPLPALRANHCSANCSWPGRLTDLLRAAFPKTEFTHVDLAVPASGITTSVANLQDLLAAAGDARSPGILLVDHTANDVVLNTPARLLLAAYEALLVGVRAQAPLLSPVLVAACPARCAAANTVVAAVAAAHRVPLVSYDRFVGSALSLARSDAPLSQDTYFKFPEGTPHPNWRVHVLVARLVGRCMAAAWELACGGGGGGSSGGPAIADPDEIAATATCSEAPWGSFNALRAAGLLPGASGAPAVSRGSWVLEEDRPGKPGWISHSGDAEARFHARFAAGRIVVTYLRSYEGQAKVSVSVMGVADSDAAPVVLDGRWEAGSAPDVSRVSQLDVAHIDVFKTWPAAPRGVDVEVLFRVIPVGDVHKVKLVNVQVC